MDYLIPLENESYQEYIGRIISVRNKQKDANEYQEHHHILPKCKGGEDTENNLIWLYAAEHFYAHKLLAKENPHDRGL